MEEPKEKPNLLKEHWHVISAIAFVAFLAGTNINSLQAVWSDLGSQSREHEHDVQVLNDEDDGVRADFVRADECNMAIAELQNEVLYWKILYETQVHNGK